MTRRSGNTTTTTTTADARVGLSRRQAIPLAIGSVAGSGILFLPSAVYDEAGRNSLLVWALATFLCFPMLLMFEDMVRAHPDGRGIESFVRVGLGDAVARCVPVLFLALVIVGLPAGALVAGRYVAQALDEGSNVAVVAAIAVLVVAVATNLAGVRASTRVQTIATWALVAVAAVLLSSALPAAGDGMSEVTPDSGTLGVVLPGVVLAFWAFAGFENLTFLSHEFRDPERDFLPVSAFALAIYGLFTILLTVAIAVRVPSGEVDEVVGLLQLAESIEPRELCVLAVTLIAFVAMVLNAVAWVWGVSQVVLGAARSGILPQRLAVARADGVARSAIVLLALLFGVTGVVLVAFPDRLVDAVATASAIFILLYLLSIVSYVRTRGFTVRSTLNAVLLVVMAVSLVQSGWRALYGVVVLVVALAVQLTQRRAYGVVPADGATVETVS